MNASNYVRPFGKAKSKWLFKPLSQCGVDALLNWLGELISAQYPYEAFWGIGGGKPGAIAQSDTAFFPRNAFGYALGFIYWSSQSLDNQAVDLLNKSYKALEPFTSAYSYSNLVDYDLGATYLHAYYGVHIRRLVEIKQQYDPKNIFHWHQGIPTKLP